MFIELQNHKVFSSDVGQSFDNNKHTIVLLHGSGQSHVVWSLIDQYLVDEGYNIFAFDLPGHGNSEGASLKSIEDMAEWLEKVILKIGIESLSILGHSQGCLIALEYAFKFPKKIKKFSPPTLVKILIKTNTLSYCYMEAASHMLFGL